MCSTWLLPGSYLFLPMYTPIIHLFQHVLPKRPLGLGPSCGKTARGLLGVLSQAAGGVRWHGDSEAVPHGGGEDALVGTLRGAAVGGLRLLGEIRGGRRPRGSWYELILG